MQETDLSRGDTRVCELMRMEYEYLTASFLANEEMGEKRIALFVTLTAGLGAAAGFAYEKMGGQAFPELWLGVNLAWLLFGYLTLLRILKRNKTTDDHIHRLQVLRQWFVAPEDEAARRYLPFDPYGSWKPPREGLDFHGNGGYAEVVAFVNSMIAGALGWQLAHYLILVTGMLFPGQRLFVTAVAALVAWIWWQRQSSLAERRYAAPAR